MLIDLETWIGRKVSVEFAERKAWKESSILWCVPGSPLAMPLLSLASGNIMCSTTMVLADLITGD